MSTLCSGVIRAKTRRDVTASARSSADSVSHSAAGDHLFGGDLEAQLVGDGGRGDRMIAGDQPDADAAVAEFRQQRAAALARGVSASPSRPTGVSSDSRSSPNTAGSAAAAAAWSAAELTLGHRQHAQTLGRHLVDHPRQRLWSSAQRRREHLGCAFDGQPGTHQRRRERATGLERQESVTCPGDENCR